VAARSRRLTPIGSRRTVLEMGYTADEFRVVLPRALRDYDISSDGAWSWRVVSAERDLALDLSIDPRPDRQIAALSIPVLLVTISFGSGTEAAKQRFRQSFNRGFQKGGG